MGEELSKLGVSFRHINKILTDLAGLDFDENKEKIARGRLVIFVFSKALSKEDDESLRAVRARIGGEIPEPEGAYRGGALSGWPPSISGFSERGMLPAWMTPSMSTSGSTSTGSCGT